MLPNKWRGLKKNGCAYILRHMMTQLTLEQCGVVFLDRRRTVLGSQPQRGQSQTTGQDCDFSKARNLLLRRADGKPLRIAHLNAEGLQRKKPELQRFVRYKAIECAASKKPISNVFAISLEDTKFFSKTEKTALRE